MNLFQKLHYANKRINSNKKMGCFVIVIITAAFITMYSSVLLFESLGYGEKTVQKSLNLPVSSYGFLSFQNNLDARRAGDFLNKINALDEIKAAGDYQSVKMQDWTTVGDTDYWDRIREIQETAGETDFQEAGTGIKMIQMNGELFDMMNIHLSEGEKYLKTGSRRWRVFLGYNLREVPVGTVFRYDVNGNEYEVTGIMEKGTCIANPGMLLYNFPGWNLDFKENMDNQMLLLLPEGKAAMGVLNLFCVNDGYTYEEAASAIRQAGEEENIEVKTGTLQARLNTVFAENRRFKNRVDMIASIICISVFMLCVTVQLLNIYMKRSELGVWIANGMSRKELFEIMWLENFIRVLTGGMIAVIIERFLLFGYFLQYQSVYREIVSFMYGKALLELVLFALLLVSVISIIPIFIIAKKQTTELVKGVWS